MGANGCCFSDAGTAATYLGNDSKFVQNPEPAGFLTILHHGSCGADPYKSELSTIVVVVLVGATTILHGVAFTIARCQFGSQLPLMPDA